MEMTIDALGQECPIPVVCTKQMLSTIDEGTVVTLVDNETAVHNLENLAKTLKCTSSVEERGDGTFAVSTTKDANSVQAVEVDSTSTGGTRVVVISSDKMGAGDDTLGGNLMKAAIFALTQQDALPGLYQLLKLHLLRHFPMRSMLTRLCATLACYLGMRYVLVFFSRVRGLSRPSFRPLILEHG